MTRLLEEAGGQRESDRKSLKEQQQTPVPALDGPVKRAQVMKTMVDAVSQSPKKFRVRELCVTEVTLMDTMKTFENDHDKQFTQEAFWCTNDNAMATMLEDDGVCDVLESVIIQVTASGPITRATPKMDLKEKWHLAPAV